MQPRTKKRKAEEGPNRPAEKPANVQQAVQMAMEQERQMPGGLQLKESLKGCKAENAKARMLKSVRSFFPQAAKDDVYLRIRDSTYQRRKYLKKLEADAEKARAQSQAKREKEFAARMGMHLAEPLPDLCSPDPS
ncbi:hypothetical protein WJX72_009111 [[Myrmecia] bisecta]|uniref:Uncharacterized protein n=1 Tax=[Myrmecia] bisecta TaxID=41462 RepID=A0AAW1Q3M6_9CHLO